MYRGRSGRFAFDKADFGLLSLLKCTSCLGFCLFARYLSRFITIQFLFISWRDELILLKIIDRLESHLFLRFRVSVLKISLISKNISLLFQFLNRSHLISPS